MSVEINFKAMIPSTAIPNSKSPTSVVAQLRWLTLLSSINEDNAATQQDQPSRRGCGGGVPSPTAGAWGEDPHIRVFPATFTQIWNCGF
jgi:hypothetical protein